MAKGKLLGCLTHAPAREAFFVLHSGFAPAALAFASLRGLPGGGGPDWVPQETRHRHINIIINLNILSLVYQDYYEYQYYCYY